MQVPASEPLYGPASPFRELPRLSVAGALARQLGSYAVLAAAIVALARSLPGGLPQPRFAFGIADLALGMGAVLAYVLYNVMFSAALGSTGRGKKLLGWMARRNLTVFGKLPLRAMLVMAALAGLCEEVIFRGWLQPLAGLWVTSALFAVLHFLPNRYKWSHPVTWGMIALYFPVGVGIGALYAWRENLLAPIVAHWLSDSLGLLFLSRAAASAGRATAAAAVPPPP
jgi:membrane protease YdiL (CAAX protease family)